jgi:hypothetical protein
MVKKIIIFTIAIILVLIGIGVLYYFLNVEPKCENLGTLMEQDSCYMQIAVKTSNVKLCDKIKNNLNVENCYRTIARNTKDNYICQALPLLEENGQSVKEDCFIDVAVASKDITPCYGISPDRSGSLSRRDYCMVLVAVEKRDTSICDIIEGKDYVTKADCIKRANAGSNDI